KVTKKFICRHIALAGNLRSTNNLRIVILKISNPSCEIGGSKNAENHANGIRFAKFAAMDSIEFANAAYNRVRSVKSTDLDFRRDVAIGILRNEAHLLPVCVSPIYQDDDPDQRCGYIAHLIADHVHLEISSACLFCIRPVPTSYL